MKKRKSMLPMHLFSGRITPKRKSVKKGYITWPSDDDLSETNDRHCYVSRCGESQANIKPCNLISEPSEFYFDLSSQSSTTGPCVKESKAFGTSKLKNSKLMKWAENWYLTGNFSSYCSVFYYNFIISIVSKCLMIFENFQTPQGAILEKGVRLVRVQFIFHYGNKLGYHFEAKFHWFWSQSRPINISFSTNSTFVFSQYEKSDLWGSFGPCSWWWIWKGWKPTKIALFHLNCDGWRFTALSSYATGFR